MVQGPGGLGCINSQRKIWPQPSTSRYKIEDFSCRKVPALDVKNDATSLRFSILFMNEGGPSLQFHLGSDKGC